MSVQENLPLDVNEPTKANDNDEKMAVMTVVATETRVLDTPQILYSEDGSPALVISQGRHYSIIPGNGSPTMMPVNTPRRQRRDYQQPQQQEDTDDDDNNDDNDDEPVIPSEHVPLPPPSRKKGPVCFCCTLNVFSIFICICALSLYMGDAFIRSGGALTAIQMACERVISSEPLRTSRNDDNAWEESSKSMCQCPGTENTGYWSRLTRVWTLHTFESFWTTHKGEMPSIYSVTAREIASDVHRDIINSLAANLFLPEGTASRVLCMHHLNMTAKYTVSRVCVLRRERGDQVLPMFNLELKGYSNASKVTMETPIRCRGKVIARQRRTVIDIAFTTQNNVEMRTLIEDANESAAIQRVWEEMRGSYTCD